MLFLYIFVGGWHIIIGSEERIGVLGNQITFVCFEVITPDGVVYLENKNILKYFLTFIN